MKGIVSLNPALDLMTLAPWEYVVVGVLFVLLIAAVILIVGYRSFRKREDKELYDVSEIRKKKEKPSEAGINHVLTLEPMPQDEQPEINGVGNIVEYRPDPASSLENDPLEERPVLLPDPIPEPEPEEPETPKEPEEPKHIYEKLTVEDDQPELTYVISPELKVSMTEEPVVICEKPEHPTSYVFKEDDEAEEYLGGEEVAPKINIIFEKEYTPTAEVKPDPAEISITSVKADEPAPVEEEPAPVEEEPEIEEEPAPVEEEPEIEEEPAPVEEEPVIEEEPAPVEEEPEIEEEPAPVEEEPEEEPADEIEEPQPEEPVPAQPLDTEKFGQRMVNGTVVLIRYRHSFLSRMIQAKPPIQDYYTVIKNHLLSYKGVKDRMSWNFESYSKGRTPCAKLNVKGKTLFVYLALDPVEYADREGKYRFKNVGDKPKFAKTPMLMRVKSDRALRYTVELIDEMMKALGIPQREIPTEDYHYPYEETEALVDRDLVKVIFPAGVVIDENTDVRRLNVSDLISSGAQVEEEPKPVEETPVEEAPVEEAPVEEAPVEEPVEETPVEEPVEETPVEEAPAEEPVEETPIEETPAEEPVEETPVEEPTEETPVEEPVEETPVEETPVEQAPVEAPVEEPIEETPVEETPAEEPVEEAPAEEPVEETPVEEAPVEEPVEETPVEETPAEEPVEEAVEETPAEEPVEEAVEETPAEEPVEETPVEEPVEEAPVEEPVEEAPVEETPVEEAPVEEPAEEVPVEEAPAEEPIEEASVEETPAEEPAEEAPVEETPVEEAPVEEPVEETPVEETPAEEPVEEEPVQEIEVVDDAISVEKAEELVSDHQAELHTQKYNVSDDLHHAGTGKFAEINIDTISENFEDGETVDFKSLKAKKLIPKNAGRVKILARGELSKKLIVYAEKYSLAAIKMIALKGGEAHTLH